ncbi:MAG TPA: 50S ribosomal protein L6 [Treponemataceae bacterium]|nr:50S ribosomal protein L6 [Treponemataceae bacterium]
MSRIGKLPVAIPEGVKISIKEMTFHVEGPKGKLSQTFDPLVGVKVEGNQAIVTRNDDTKMARSYHGLYRNLLNNMVMGVTKGFSKTLVITGVGYRAEVQGNLLVLNLGYSNDFIAGIPEGLTVVAEAQGRLTISGIRKDQVGEFAAEIRKLRGPEPYKGKGIRYDTEIIKRKVGKSGVK